MTISAHRELLQKARLIGKEHIEFLDSEGKLGSSAIEELLRFEKEECSGTADFMQAEALLLHYLSDVLLEAVSRREKGARRKEEED